VIESGVPGERNEILWIKEKRRRKEYKVGWGLRDVFENIVRFFSLYFICHN